VFERKTGVCSWHIASPQYLDVVDPDGLCVYERVCTEISKLSTVAAVFDAAYGNARVRSSDAVGSSKLSKSFTPRSVAVNHFQRNMRIQYRIASAIGYSHRSVAQFERKTICGHFHFKLRVFQRSRR